jgi:hypothetical protein
MPRDITVTFEDGSQHEYKSAPDDITPDAVAERAQKEFNLPITHIDGGKSAEAPKEAPSMLNRFMAHPYDTYAQEAQNLAGGVVGGVADVAVNAADLIHALPAKQQNLSSLIAPSNTTTADDYKAAVQQKLQDFGVKPESGAYGVGKFGGEIAATLPIGGALGAGSKVLGASPRIVAALKSGGISTGEAEGFAKNLLTKAAAGASVGGLTGQVIAPENDGGLTGSAVGGGVGAATSIINPAAKLGYKIVEPIFERGREAIANRKMRDIAGGAENIPLMIDRLRNKGVTPEELAVRMQSPELAGSIRTSEEQFPKDWIPKRAAEAEAMATNVNQAQSSLNALHQGEMPVSNVSAAAPYQNVQSGLAAQAGGLENTKAARTAELLRQAETQQVGIEEAKQQVASTIAQPEQRKIGQSIAARKVALEDEAKALVSPIYNQAFELAPEPFSVQPLIDKASKIADKISTAINKDTAPLTDKALTVFKQKAEEGPAILDARGKPMKNTTEGIPHAAKLEDLKELRSVVLKEARNLKGDPKSGLTLANLDLLRQGIEESIAKHAPSEARAIFNQANELYRTTVAEPFKEGAVSNLTRQTSNARPKISPSDVTERMLQPDRAADFIRAFGNDPEALQAIATGVEGKFNAEVVQGGKSADKFLKDNREALKTLDSTGAGIQNRLSEIVRNFEPIEANQAALGEQVKAIPKVVGESVANQQRIISKSAKDLSGATDPENLAKIAVSGDARLMGRILHKLSPEAKPELANQVIKNAFEPITTGADNASAKTAKALDNSRIAVALKATYGKEEGAAKLADFKETAHIQSLIEKVKKDTPSHPYDTAQALDTLTTDKPLVKRAVEDILATLNDQKKFAELAASGRKAKEGTINLASTATPVLPFSLTRVASMAKWVHTTLLKSADTELADKISKELMSSESFANALERAQQAEEFAIPTTLIERGRIIPRAAPSAITSISGEK